MSGAGKVVCVTGAAGYVASWLVKLLLLRGYTVKGTIRNLSDPKKVVHLMELEGANERLHLFEANLLEDGSFDSVVDGCDGVFHTASPAILSVTDPEKELLEPAIKGTLNVLKSCSKTTSVRRVVITSSTAAVMRNRNPIGPDVVIDETWFSDAEFCKETKQWYVLSKTLAEEAAWKFAKENAIDLVTLHPGLVIGPLLQPTLNLSSEIIVDILKGKELFPAYSIVDVRDVGNAHILAFEDSSANGRYVLVGTMMSHFQVKDMLQKLYPALNFPSNCSVAEKPTVSQVSKKKAESLGVKFMPVEVSLKDVVESLKEKKFIAF